MSGYFVYRKRAQMILLQAENYEIWISFDALRSIAYSGLLSE